VADTRASTVDAVPPDVAEAVHALHASTDELARRLLDRETVLVHGDLRLANLALTPELVVLFDWVRSRRSHPPPSNGVSTSRSTSSA
jgi:aminoglycoside phosphotransferase (APT) family kinase protein